MSGCKYPGGCATTAIRIAYTEDSDPFMYGRLELFRAWLHILVALQPQRKSLSLAWIRAVRSLQASPRPWFKAKGTMSAVIVSLLGLNWTPAGPALWIDSDGERFDLDEWDHDRLIEYALRGAVSESIWLQASRWHHGRGLHQGPDATTLLRHLRRLRRAGAHGEAAVLQMVAAGAL